MARLTLVSMAVTPARSRPFSPMTTRRLARCSSALPGAIELMAESARRRPAPSSRIGLPATSTKPFMRSTSCAAAASARRATSSAGSRAAGDLDDEALEIVVIVVLLRRRDARGGWRDRPPPPRRGRAEWRDRAAPRWRARSFAARGAVARICAATCAFFLLAQQIGLVEHDEIGAERADPRTPPRADCRGRSSAVSARSLAMASRSSAKRPAATAGPSTTAMTPSTVRCGRIAGHSKALTSGLGRARPRRLDDDVLGALRDARAAPRSPARNHRPRCSTGSRWRARRCFLPGSSRRRRRAKCRRRRRRRRIH